VRGSARCDAGLYGPRTFLALFLLVGTAAAQAPARRPTTIDALRQFPRYFHLQNVLVHGEFAEEAGRVVLRAGEREIRVLLNEARTMTGMAEVRGVMLDVGRLEAGDPRVARYDGVKDPEQWPQPGEDLLLSVTAVSAAQLATTASVRGLALQPWRFDGQAVSVVGEFRGRNLFGDLPNSPGKSRYDFVLRSADTAVWVTGLRPRGRGFDLNVDARVDTGRWLQVTGVVSQDKGLVIIAATALATATEPKADPAADDEPAIAPEPLRPGAVTFSAPTPDETEVPGTTPVRVQFSRGLDPNTLPGNIRVSYLGNPMPIEFQHTYDAGTNSIQINFVRPLERFATVKVELLEGVRMFDGAPLTPWSLTFSVGAN
jgi:hypothetical protein